MVRSEVTCQRAEPGRMAERERIATLPGAAPLLPPPACPGVPRVPSLLLLPLALLLAVSCTASNSSFNNPACVFRCTANEKER